MGLHSMLKEMARSDSSLLNAALWLSNHLPFYNHLRGGKIGIRCAQLKKTRIVIHGSGNRVEISRGCRLTNCSIHISGNNNRVVLESFVSMTGADLWIEDDNNEIFFGEHTSIAGSTHLACVEGTKIRIGKDCMLSANISIRTGDSHSIVDSEKRRINPSRDVCIGDHVWIGNTVLITKGVVIGPHSVVGTGSVVTRQFAEDHIVIAGNPAKAVKHGISWERAYV